MKKLGIIGGMSWESTQTYYRLLNEGVRARLGGLHSCELLLYSFDFARIEGLQSDGAWDEASDEMVKAALSLKAAGADYLLIATNTMHKMAQAVEEACALPVLHIADATAYAIKENGVTAPLLLATNFTMTQDFYKGHLKDNHNITAIVPKEAHRSVIHDVIYPELCQGKIHDESRASYLDIITHYNQAGLIDSVIFGCTEIGLLLSAKDVNLPVFDTTEIHCHYALDRLLSHR